MSCLKSALWRVHIRDASTGYWQWVVVTAARCAGYGPASYHSTNMIQQLKVLSQVSVRSEQCMTFGKLGMFVTSSASGMPLFNAHEQGPPRFTCGIGHPDQIERRWQIYSRKYTNLDFEVLLSLN